MDSINQAASWSKDASISPFVRRMESKAVGSIELLDALASLLVYDELKKKRRRKNETSDEGEFSFFSCFVSIWRLSFDSDFTILSMLQA